MKKLQLYEKITQIWHNIEHFLGLQWKNYNCTGKSHKYDILLNISWVCYAKKKWTKDKIVYSVFKIYKWHICKLKKKIQCNLAFFCAWFFFYLLSWNHELRPKKKKLTVSVAVPPAPVRVPSQRPLAPSGASVTSVANDKGDNDSGGCAKISWHLPHSWGKPPENLT